MEKVAALETVMERDGEGRKERSSKGREGGGMSRSGDGGGDGTG